MAVIVPFRYTDKVTTYHFIEDGIYITENHSTWFVYLLIGLIIWFGIGWSIPSPNLVLVFLIAVPVSIILGYGILKVKVVDESAHQKYLIPWHSFERAELEGQHITLYIFENEAVQWVKKKRSYLVEFDVEKDNLPSLKEMFAHIFGERFIIINK